MIQKEVKVKVCKLLKNKLDLPYFHILVILGKSTHETPIVDDGIIRSGLLLIKKLIDKKNKNILDQSRIGSSGIDKSHGTRLSDQSIDDTIRKPAATKTTSDETKVPETFDVNKIHTKLFYLFQISFKPSKIASAVFIMERVLNLNTNQTKQAIYRGLTPLIIKEDSKFTLKSFSIVLKICFLICRRNSLYWFSIGKIIW
jgi:hypothetical protein